MSTMDDRQKATAIALAGLVLIGMNFMALAPFVAGQVEAGVGDTIAAGYDSEEDYDDEWSVSTPERSYFGYSITNVDELTENSAVNAEFEKMGPFVYEVQPTELFLALIQRLEPLLTLNMTSLNGVKTAHGLMMRVTNMLHFQVQLNLQI